MESEPIKISPSQLNLFQKCQKWWSYKYLDRLPPEPKPITASFISGCILHQAVNTWIKSGKSAPIPLVSSFLEEFLNNNPDCPLKFTEKLPLLELMKRLQITAEAVKAKLIGRFKRVLLAEEELQVELPTGFILRGFPDIVAIDENNNTVLVDIKCSHRIKTVTEVRGYYLQLCSYAFLLQLHDIHVDRIEILSLAISSSLKPRNGSGFNIAWVPLEGDFEQDFKDTLNSFCDHIFFKLPALRNGIQQGTCGWCAYAQHCLGKEVVKQNAA
ncbi:RecB family exonuclease [Candidatus Riflebacteria bacterium]